MKRMVPQVPHEDTEQIWLFRWAADMQRLKYPELELMHHIPNGGHRSKAEAGRFKAEGVKAGIPDVFLPVARNGFHGLYIELKRQKYGRLSPDQEDKIPKLRAQGYRVEVCKGFQQAADLIEDYLSGKLENPDAPKEKQPRVIPLEELTDENSRFDVVWAESTGTPGVTAPRRIKIEGKQAIVKRFGSTQFSIAELADYGITWRCWDMRPALAQQQAEPWKAGPE